ncbi:MAG: hypothetical protein JWM21_862 [Acidobacteria bacterium]|nr:hypothetical protein [Acidobacteriota bacterium]
MGSVSREAPVYLGEKLLMIRKRIEGGLSQEEMVRLLGFTDELDRSYVSRYEAGILEPPLKVLLRYAELAGVHLEVLADDDLALPQNLPCRPISSGLKKESNSMAGKRIRRATKK